MLKSNEKKKAAVVKYCSLKVHSSVASCVWSTHNHLVFPVEDWQPVPSKVGSCASEKSRVAKVKGVGWAAAVMENLQEPNLLLFCFECSLIVFRTTFSNEQRSVSVAEI